MKIEKWEHIKGFEGIYQVSNVGNVKSLDRVTIGIDGKASNHKSVILKHSVSKKGYHSVKLCKKGKELSFRVHRLVALAFISNPKDKLQVNHINGREKWNNSMDNLEWATNQENIQHAYKTGLNKGPRGEKAQANKLKEHEVVTIREMYESVDNTLSQAAIGRLFKVTKYTIWDIVHNKSWRHLKLTNG